MCAAKSSCLVEATGWDVDVEDGDVNVVNHFELMRSCGGKAGVDFNGSWQW
jgi:hypothetical protein